MKTPLVSCLAVSLSVFSAVASAHDEHIKNLNVSFNNCTEFAGIASVDATKASALVPAGFTLVTDGDGAKLVVRVSDCASIKVDGEKAQAGRVAHIGLMIQSPDGTATDPNTSINNYTLAYASNLPALVDGLKSKGVKAALDSRLAYEFTPASGTSALYAATAPDSKDSPRWFLTGTVNTPSIPSPFLANWWASAKGKTVKMASTFPIIYFDFASQVSFYTSLSNPVGNLVGQNSIPNFPLSFRGQFPAAQMSVSVLP